MKRFSLAIMMVVTITGLAWVVAVPSASARTRGTPTMNSQVGVSTTKVLGPGKVFALKACTSASSATVSCEVWNPAPPNGTIRILCAAATNGTPVALTVTFVADGAHPALSPENINVNCRGVRTSSMRAPSDVAGPVLKGSPPPYTVTGCTTNLMGAQCIYAGESLIRACTLAATLNTLPATSEAIVTLASVDPTINGVHIDLPFRCR